MADMFKLLPEIDTDELIFVKETTANMDDDSAQSFAMAYRARRRDPQTVLLLALLGFLGVSGVHRFYINHVGMGILYFLTGGLCLIGTIVDLVNHKSLAREYNYNQAQSIVSAMRMNTPGQP
jgi:TM2 domain-containing membrane protein YozV